MARRPRPRHGIATSLVLAVALALAACGDDDATMASAAGESSGSASAPETTPESTGTETTVTESTVTRSTATETTASPATTAAPAGQTGGEVTVEHYSGTDTVPVDPETVVVLDAGIMLSLDALGVDAVALAGLGIPIPDEYSAALADPDLAEIGTAFEPDYEAINALEPDLIIVATRSSATYPEMSEIAPTVDLTFDEGVPFLEAFRQRHEAIGRIFGIEDEVEQMLTGIESRAAGIEAAAADAGTALVVMTSGAEVSAYGPGSRFGLVHDLGYQAADDSLERDATHGDVISFEFIREAAPDVLFVVDRGAAIGEEGQAAEQVLDNVLVADTPAWTNGRVVYVDSFAWYIAANSIPAIQAVLDDLEAGLG